MLTLSDCKADLGLRRVTAATPDSPEFADYVNAAVRRLRRRGDWPGTVVPIYVAAYRGRVVWPRYVDSVRAANVCPNHPVEMHNVWWEFLPRTTVCSGWSHHGSMTNLGQTSVFQNIMREDSSPGDRYLRAYARASNDYGKTLKIFGVDGDGKKLVTQGTYGDWTEGITLTLAAPYVQSTQIIRHIDYVLKDKTDLPVDLYAYNSTTALLEDCAHYEASETRPSYEMVEFHAECAKISGYPAGVQALVKLRYIKAESDDDLIIIDDLDAIKYEIQAIKKGEAEDRTGELQRKQDALSELNRDTEDRSPDNQFSVSVVAPFSYSRTNRCF